MISSLGFLPNVEPRKKLEKYVPNDSVKEKLEYLNIPIVNDEEKDEEASDSDEEILETDSMLFAAINTEEISSLAFYVYNNETFFCHHDLFVFSTIFDCAYIGNNNVAVATYEPDIFIYNAFTKFPILPQQLLIGHEASVTGIKNNNDKIFSCSEDKTIIEWDLEKLAIKNRSSYDIPIDRFDFEENNLAFGTNDYLNINNESFSLSSNIEKIKIHNGIVYVLDSVGNIILYDVRNLQNSIYEEKIHDDAIFDIAIFENKIATASSDKTIKIWENTNKFELKASYEKKSIVYSIGFDSKGKLFCGDESENITSIIIDK